VQKSKEDGGWGEKIWKHLAEKINQRSGDFQPEISKGDWVTVNGLFAKELGLFGPHFARGD